MTGSPTLWHLPISHFNEKVRWALDYKRVPHSRRIAPGGAHTIVALAKSRGQSLTFPVLELDGDTYADSTAIIAALEARWPEPPLYPADPEERERALALEDHFDETIGPAIRHFVYWNLMDDPERFEEIVNSLLVRLGPLEDVALARRASAAATKRALRLRFGIGPEDAAHRHEEVCLEAFERLDSELDGRDHLVGDSFTVADLTAAALFYPLALPEGGPSIGEPPASLVAWREPLLERHAYRWIGETYRRYREPAGVAMGSPTTA